MLLIFIVATAIAGPKIMVQANDEDAYTTAKSAVAGGSVFGVSVTELLSNAGQRLIYLEVDNTADLRSVYYEVATRPASYRVIWWRVSDLTAADMWNQCPQVAVDAYLLGVSQP